MNKMLDKILDKLMVKQWNIGLARVNIEQLIATGKIDDIDFTWLPTGKTERFFADPFIFKHDDGHINVIYEDYSNADQYGKISITKLDDEFKVISTKEILDTKSHQSYPNVYTHNGVTYVMPEASLSGILTRYEFEYKSSSLINPVEIIAEPLLDSTILEHEGKYWLFATKRGADSNSKLYIYFADTFDGPYTAHAKNPVKDSLNGSRPAGNFIMHNGKVYRPAQNSSEYYGKSIAMNLVTKLTTEEFMETHLFTIEPPKNTLYNFATHTINLSGDVIVIDGLRRKFMPFKQIGIFLKKILK